jgi:integrase
VQKRIGPAWTERGRPPAGYFTKRLAEDWLRQTLDEARRGTVPWIVRSGATFAEAAAEYLRYVAEDRGRKASTVGDYRSIIQVHLLPEFSETLLEDITPSAIEALQARLAKRGHRGRPITARTRNKILIVLHGTFARAKKMRGLPMNPAGEIERHPDRSSGDIDVFSPEEVHAHRSHLARLRGAQLAFRVTGSYADNRTREVDVAPVPMVDEVAQRLTRVSEREWFVGDDDLVFGEVDGRWLNDDRLRRRYEAVLRRAGLRRLRFHDLASCFRLARDHARGHRRGTGLALPCRRPTVGSNGTSRSRCASMCFEGPEVALGVSSRERPSVAAGPQLSVVQRANDRRVTIVSGSGGPGVLGAGGHVGPERLFDNADASQQELVADLPVATNESVVARSAASRSRELSYPRKAERAWRDTRHEVKAGLSAGWG